MDTILAVAPLVIITCQDCQSQYEVADEKIHGRSVRIRCRSCGARIFLSLEVTTPAQVARPAIAPPRDDSADATAPRAAAVYASPLDELPATGGRHETSVLFTLAALSGSLRTSKSASPKKEDSGLIDLNALSTSGAELTPRNVKAAALSEPPLGAFTTTVSYAPPAQARRAHFYGAGIAAIALLAMIGLGFGMRGEKIESADVLAAAAPVVRAAQPAVVAPAPAAPAPEVVASTATEVPSVAAAAKGKAKKGGKRAGGAKSGGAHKAASAPRAPAANDACGCHGNLMCAMNCASH